MPYTDTWCFGTNIIEHMSYFVYVVEMLHDYDRKENIVLCMFVRSFVCSFKKKPKQTVFYINSYLQLYYNIIAMLHGGGGYSGRRWVI